MTERPDLQQTLGRLLGPAEPEVGCDECFEELDRYVELELAGGAADAAVPVVRLFARRFTVQERLGEQIADTLEALIEPRGVAVRLEAAHLCTRMRGVEEDSHTVTTFWRGAYGDVCLRHEFLDEVRSRKGGR